jgi:hypothetical protein
MARAWWGRERISSWTQSEPLGACAVRVRGNSCACESGSTAPLARTTLRPSHATDTHNMLRWHTRMCFGGRSAGATRHSGECLSWTPWMTWASRPRPWRRHFSGELVTEKVFTLLYVCIHTACYSRYSHWTPWMTWAYGAKLCLR